MAVARESLNPASNNQAGLSMGEYRNRGYGVILQGFGENNGAPDVLHSPQVALSLDVPTVGKRTFFHDCVMQWIGGGGRSYELFVLPPKVSVATPGNRKRIDK